MCLHAGKVIFAVGAKKTCVRIEMVKKYTGNERLWTTLTHIYLLTSVAPEKHRVHYFVDLFCVVAILQVNQSTGSTRAASLTAHFLFHSFNDFQ